jgi:hypothetical protein
MPTQDGGLALSLKAGLSLAYPTGAYGASMPSALKMSSEEAATPRMKSA